MGDLRFAEARGVVFKGDMVLRFIDAHAAQAVGVGEGAQAAELFGLKFVGNFNECHSGSIAASRVIFGAAGSEEGKLRLTVYRVSGYIYP